MSMMLKAKFVGIGAAGNKAVINLIKKYPELENDYVLVNSTLKDIPEEYQSKSVELVGEFRGCAKERSKANEMMSESIGQEVFDVVLDDDTSMVIIATSSEGGTGSGASTVLAQYVSQVYSIPVHVYAFTGFEDDARGLKNTVDFFKEGDSNYIIHAISNKKFLDEANGNRLKAEQLANDKFASDVNIILGGTIVPSSQNIDQSDLLKLTNTPGYMTVETIDLSRVKNVQDYNERITEALDSSKNLTVEATCKRIGVIFNLKEKSQAFVDFSNAVLKERYGSPFEVFTHIQDVGNNEYAYVITSGLKLPIQDIEDAYNAFKEATSRVDTSADSFFSGKDKFDTDTSQFDSLTRVTTTTDQIKKAKAAFLNKGKKRINNPVSDEF